MMTPLIYELIPEFKDYNKYVKQDLKVAVIGFGKMGILHSVILNLLKSWLIKMIADKNYLTIIGSSKLIRNIRFYRDANKMLEKEKPDICYVTTPVTSHYPIVSSLLEAGIKYVFVEKPPTLNLKQLDTLLDKVSINQIVMVGLQKRYAFPFRHAKILLSKNTLGDIKKVSAYIKSGDITTPTDRFNRIGRGVLLDLGIHLVDLLQWLVGLESVEEATYEKKYTNVDDYFEATLKTTHDANVNMEVTWSDPSYRLPETYIEIHGTNGMLKVTEDYLKVEVKDRENLKMFKPHYYQGIPPVNLADPEYTLENIHFLYCINRSKEPLTSLKNVRRTMEIIDDLYKMARVKHG